MGIFREIHQDTRVGPINRKFSPSVNRLFYGVYRPVGIHHAHGACRSWSAGKRGSNDNGSGFGAAHTSAARLNFYPAKDPVPAQERESVTPLGDMALHHHTDPGAITLLLQDNAGGLQALSRANGWIDVPPLDGAIVVNIGDILQVWTNDRCSAGVHRVVPVTNPSGRFSIPFFYQPKVDAVVEPWLGRGRSTSLPCFFLAGIHTGPGDR